MSGRMGKVPGIIHSCPVSNGIVLPDRGFLYHDFILRRANIPGCGVNGRPPVTAAKTASVVEADEIGRASCRERGKPWCVAEPTERSKSNYIRPSDTNRRRKKR